MDNLCSIADNIELKTVIGAANKFAGHFSQMILRTENGNVISSPLSAYVVLAQAAYGARGETASQMRGVLHIPGDDAVGRSGFKSLLETVNGVSNVELRLANRMYIASGFKVIPEFENVLLATFLSTSEKLDFSNSPVDAARSINSWCKNQTNNHIKEIVSPADFDRSTKLVLCNAVYFKGNWAEPFDPQLTHDKSFHISETEVKDVPTMFAKSEFSCGSISEFDAQFVELPYKGNEFSMVIILPNKVSGLRAVVHGMQHLNLADIVQRGCKSEIYLYLPKFKIETKLDLVDVLRKMGMVDMFDERADFSGIADTKLFVSKVIQKAFIEVNEEGSEAAAFSEPVLCEYSMPAHRPKSFKIDRPFKYFICHRSKGIYSLFDGVVREPIWT